MRVPGMALGRGGEEGSRREGGGGEGAGGGLHSALKTLPRERVFSMAKNRRKKRGRGQGDRGVSLIKRLMAKMEFRKPVPKVSFRFSPLLPLLPMVLALFHFF